jgi:hypothetical protein
MLLEPLAVDHPVERRRRDQQGGGGGAEHQRHHVGAPLEARDRPEAGLESQGEQEREQDLHARLGHPDFLQELAVGAVGSLHGCLTPRSGVPVIVIVNRQAAAWRDGPRRIPAHRAPVLASASRASARSETRPA